MGPICTSKCTQFSNSISMGARGLYGQYPAVVDVDGRLLTIDA